MQTVWVPMGFSNDWSQMLQLTPASITKASTKITSTATTATDHTLAAGTTYVRIIVRSGDTIQLCYGAAADRAVVLDTTLDMEVPIQTTAPYIDIVLPKNTTKINYRTLAGNSTVFLILEW